MTILVLVILAAIWAAVLLPPWLETRRSSHPRASVVDFHQQLAVLDRANNPSSIGMPRRPMVRTGLTRTVVPRRRRDVLTTLVAAAGLTLGLALLLGGTVWLLQLAVDAVLLGYVALLLQVQQARAVPNNVRYLHSHDMGYEAPQMLLRRAR